MVRNITKRAMIGGVAAVVLVAGVSVGGALVTRNSTIADNVFGKQAEPNLPAEMTVDGEPINETFTGALDGEYVFENYNVNNLSDAADLKFNVSAKPEILNYDTKKLFEVLNTRIIVGTNTIETGKLNKMSIPANQLPAVTAGTTKKVRVEVYVASADEFQKAGIADHTELKVDFLFDSLFTTAPTTP